MIGIVTPCSGAFAGYVLLSLGKSWLHVWACEALTLTPHRLLQCERGLLSGLSTVTECTVLLMRSVGPLLVPRTPNLQ